ncbi:MAG: hypothetical protein GXO25_01060 [Euryarchaeota archaeon]|nr:hypothetical protein [Euryarchaeota archaeon]
MGRIHVKFVILGLIIILLFSTAPLAHGWSEGKSWAYRWTGDWNVIIRHNANETHSLNVEGKYAEAYMIQYAGKDSAGYKFRYEGGYYTYGNMHMKTNDTTSFGSYENNITAKIKEIWIDFDGEFHLVKVGDTSNSYYGIKDFSVHIFTRAPLSIFVNSTSIGDSGTHVKRVSGHVLSLFGTFNVYLNASYSSPIPYLPASPDFRSADIFSSNVNYSAHISYDTRGFN